MTEDQHDGATSIINEYMEEVMPVVTYEKKKAGGFVASALPLLRDVADRMQVSFGTSPKIIFANLSYLGVVADAVLTEVIGHIRDCINVDIKNSCAIIVMPTVGTRGDCRNPQNLSLIHI